MASAESSAGGDPWDEALLSSLFALEDGYRHKMGLRRAAAAEFYAPTPAGPAIRAEKQAILDRTGDRHTLVTPEGHVAAVEFARLMGFPVTVSLEADANAQREFNRQLGSAVEPDLLLVQPPDWSLAWANVCFPSRWSLEGKSRRPLAWIHDAVPGLNAELADKIAVFFSRMTPGEGWRRANWGLSASAVRNQHPDEAVAALGVAPGTDRMFIRVEDQHLLKLPDTGTIAFGIRIASFAWSAVMEHPVFAASLHDKLRAMPKEVALYKGIPEFIPLLTEEIRIVHGCSGAKPDSLPSGGQTGS